MKKILLCTLVFIFLSGFCYAQKDCCLETNKTDKKTGKPIQEATFGIITNFYMFIDIVHRDGEVYLEHFLDLNMDKKSTNAINNKVVPLDIEFADKSHVIINSMDTYQKRQKIYEGN